MPSLLWKPTSSVTPRSSSLNSLLFCVVNCRNLSPSTTKISSLSSCRLRLERCPPAEFRLKRRSAATAGSPPCRPLHLFLRVDRAIVDDEKPEPFAVRTESRRANTAIEIFSGFETRRRPAAVRGHKREMVHAVRAVLHLVAFKKRDHLSIRAPLRSRNVRRACLQALIAFRRAGFGFDDVKLCRDRDPIVRVIAHESDARSVR